LPFAALLAQVIKLTLALETQDLINHNRIKKCLHVRERHHFVCALKQLLSFLMLFRDSENNVDHKIKMLKL
jgi:hypothetical protein